MKTLDQILGGLPEERREHIAARSEELILEEHALRRLRKARKLTQERMAELLGVRQDSISRLERRSDLLLSTLRSYVEAMGGSLQLLVKFDDERSVALSSLLESEDRSAVGGTLCNNGWIYHGSDDWECLKVSTTANSNCSRRFIDTCLKDQASNSAFGPWLVYRYEPAPQTKNRCGAPYAWRGGASGYCW